MKYLVFATAIWAFSFSLIGVYLSGKVDPYFSAWIRITLAVLLFCPFLWTHRTTVKKAMILMGIGGIQLGLMYLFYYQSFELLSVPEVLIFTIFTPVYVTLIHDLFQKRFSLNYLITALLAVIGAAVVRWGSISSGFFIGFLAVQGSNLCFALGQVGYKHFKKTEKTSGRNDFGYFYIGAWIVSSIALLLCGKPNYPTQIHQWGILLWLGLIASGIGYFLWNLGAKKVNAGALAVMNNLLIPAGLLVNISLWNRETDLTRLGIGSVIMLFSLWLNQKLSTKAH